MLASWFASLVVKQEDANTVTCSCMPATTVIDSKTCHATLVWKKMEDEQNAIGKVGDSLIESKRAPTFRVNIAILPSAFPLEDNTFAT
jgi:hypothetical protein